VQTPATTPAGSPAAADTQNPAAPSLPPPQTLPRFTVRNFTEAHELRVSTSAPIREESYDIPALVSLRASGGPMDFQLSMTAAQARTLAAFIIAGADTAENLE
jgi:hypothetical protein